MGGTFGGGGIIYGTSDGGGTLTLNGVTVDGNTATQGPGGGIASGARGNLTIINSTISNNTASSPALARPRQRRHRRRYNLLDQGGANQLNISNSTISGNRAAYTADAGGGLHISGGTATIQRTHFVENLAVDDFSNYGLGGAIAHGNGTLNVSFSRFVGNAGTNGAAIWQSRRRHDHSQRQLVGRQRGAGVYGPGWHAGANGHPLAATAPQRQPLFCAHDQRPPSRPTCWASTPVDRRRPATWPVCRRSSRCRPA